MKTPLYFQSERNECGIACLAMVASTFNPNCDITQLRRRFGIGQRGLTIQQMMTFAEQIGLLSRGVKVEIDDLTVVRKPAILHWELDHFVVLVSVKRRGIEIYDPAVGRCFVKWPEVSNKFTGVALELWPAPAGDSSVSDISAAIGSVRQRLSLVTLWRRISGSASNLGWVIALSLMLQCLLIAGPWHMQWTVDKALLEGDQSLVAVLAVGFAMLLAIRVCVMWLRSMVVIHLGHQLAFMFASQLLNHLVHLPLEWFGKRSVGDIAARFTSLEPVRDFFTQGAAALLVDGLVVLLSLVVMFGYSIELAAIVLAVQIVFVVGYAICVPRLQRLSMGAVVASGAEQGHLIETIRGMHSVKVYGQEGHRYSQWQKFHAQTILQNLSLQRTHGHMSAFNTLLVGGELVAVVTVGAYAVLDGGGFSVGMLFAFLAYRGFFSQRLRSLVEQWINMRTLQVHLDRVADIWLTEIEPSIEAPSTIQAHCDVIALSELCFRYDSFSPQLLESVSIEIAAGEFVAIVGASGAGKSTLLRLLMGLSTPTAGHIMVGRTNLVGGGASQFRRLCGCVLQEDQLFSGSILDNVTLFENIDEERVWQVLSDTGMANDIAALPMGLRTPLGEIDSQFSSGQIQRLLLSRALYRNPQYLFLDEGTANLDEQSARTIELLVAGLKCTRVVITHDLNFARQAQRVLLLQDGRLDEIRP